MNEITISTKTDYRTAISTSGWISRSTEKFKRTVISVPGNLLAHCDIKMYTQNVDGESTRVVTMDIKPNTFDKLLREMYKRSDLSKEHSEEVREHYLLRHKCESIIENNRSEGWDEGYKAGFLTGFNDGKPTVE